MVPVMLFGAESWEPSTVKTGIPASLKRLKFLMVFSSVVFEGRAWWKRSPAIIMKSGFSSIVLSVSSVKALSKSCLLASSPYCAYPRCRSEAWTKLKAFTLLVFSRFRSCFFMFSCWGWLF